MKRCVLGLMAGIGVFGGLEGFAANAAFQTGFMSQDDGLTVTVSCDLTQLPQFKTILTL